MSLLVILTWNGSTYNASGTYTWTGVNSNGCDSIATLNLVINSPTTSTTNESACNSYTWNGSTYMQVELTLGQELTQTDVIVFTLNLVINSPTTSTANGSAVILTLGMDQLTMQWNLHLDRG